MSTRIRTIKPEWLEDSALAEAGTHARLLSVSLIVLADDHGRGRANEVVVAAKVFTYEADPVGCLREALASLSRIGFVELYRVRGQPYYYIRNWAKHQRIDRPSHPRFPAPEEADPDPSTPPITPAPPPTKAAKSPTLASLSRNPQPSLASDRDLDQGSGSGPRPGASRTPAPARTGARAHTRDDGVPLDVERLHQAWLTRWRQLDRGEPSGGTYAMASTCWATEWDTLLTKIEAHALSLGQRPEHVAEAMLEALFASRDHFVTKDYNPKLLVSQFAQWAPQERQNDELATLDRELDLAEQRGDYAEVEALKARIEALCAAAQSRKASA